MITNSQSPVRPVTAPQVRIACPQLGSEEEAAVLEVMRSGVLAQGPRTQAFERAFAASTGAKFGIATCNGSVALQLALLAHGIGPGDEVITSPLTFIATANAIVHAGATPVFADVDDSLNLSCEAAAEAIGPRTRAIVLVHLHGNPGDVIALTRLAEENGLALIQDACQAVGATVRDKPLGQFGTAVYSFYATKNITTGEGGMVTTNDEQVARTCAHLRHQAYSDEPYVHDAVGFNFRMSELHAAIGLVQLGKLDVITQRRRDNAAYYDRYVSRWYGRPRVEPGHAHVYHQFTLRAPEGWPRDQIRAQMKRGGVETGVYYPVPLHRQPPFRDSRHTACPVAESAAAETFSVPVHAGLSEGDRLAVASHLNGIVARELWG